MARSESFVDASRDTRAGCIHGSRAVREVAATLLLLVTAVSCKETTEVVSVGSVIVSPPTVTLITGRSQQLTASVFDANGVALARNIQFGTSNQAIATVTSLGLVTALTPGVATVEAVAGGKVGQSVITVIREPVVSVTLQPAGPQTLRVTNMLQLVPTMRDGNNLPLTGRTVIWTTSNSALAFVSNTGLVSALAPGNVTITAESEGRQATSSITITLVPATAVTVSPNPHAMFTGSVTQFSVALQDSAGGALSTAGRTITWSSSNLPVATVAASGVVSAVAAGQATISATVDQATGTSQLTVNAIPIASVSITPPSTSLKVRTSFQLTATPRDNFGTSLGGRAVIWASSNPSVVTVSSTGIATGVAVGGPVTITATAEGVVGTSSVTIIP